jgi:hypothetical protein
MSAKEPVADERLLIETLCRQIGAVMDASSAAAGAKTIATMIVAARYARRTGMPPILAASMIADYINRGDPI